MVTAGDFKNGITIEYDGKICQIIEFQHVKPGKGAAFVRTKLKDIKSGGVVETTFRPTEKFENAHIDRKDMQYLYNDGDLYYFMDGETYDQIAVSAEKVGDSLKFVKVIFLQLNHLLQLNFRLQKQNLDSRVTQQLMLLSQQLLKQEQQYMFHCLLNRVKQLLLIHVQENIQSVFNA